MLQVQILRCVSILASSGQGKEPPAIADSYYEVRQLCFVISGLQDLVLFVSPLFSLQALMIGPYHHRTFKWVTNNNKVAMSSQDVLPHLIKWTRYLPK